MGAGSMSVVIHAGRLRQEIARRGWAGRDLARAAHLSDATISAAMAGRPIAARSMMRIAEALLRAPTLDIADSLLMSDGDSPGVE